MHSGFLQLLIIQITRIVNILRRTDGTLVITVIGLFHQTKLKNILVI